MCPFLPDRFGVRPSLEVIDVASIFSEGADSHKRYAPQTLQCVFMLLGGRIAKSPAWQPKLQSALLGNIKGCLELSQQHRHQMGAVTEPGSFAASMSKGEIRRLMPAAWKAFEEEGESDQVCACRRREKHCACVV